MSVMVHNVFCSDPDNAMVCPCCGYNYTHIDRVFTRLGRDEHEAGIYEGTRQEGTTDSRRSALVVVFDCEAGCKFEVVIQQHKGMNYVEINGVTLGKPATIHS